MCRGRQGEGQSEAKECEESSERRCSSNWGGDSRDDLGAGITVSEYVASARSKMASERSLSLVFVRPQAALPSVAVPPRLTSCMPPSPSSSLPRSLSLSWPSTGCLDGARTEASVA
jgi:hypothetical protein